MYLRYKKKGQLPGLKEPTAITVAQVYETSNYAEPETTQARFADEKGSPRDPTQQVI